MLAEEGAGSLVLLPRSGRSADDSRELLQRLLQFVVDVRVEACDVSAMGNVLSMASGLRARLGAAPLALRLRGLLHLAAVLDDATLPNFARVHLERAFGAKVGGSSHLRTR